MDRVFANGPADLGLIPGRVIPKTLKMVLDTALDNTQQYKVRIKGKVEQSRERSSTPQHLSVVAIEKGTFWSPSTKGRQLYLLIYLSIYLSTGDPCGFNKGGNSKFREGSRVRQTPEEGRRTYRPKRCGNNNKDGDNSPKTLNDKDEIRVYQEVGGESIKTNEQPNGKETKQFCSQVLGLERT